ncbi:hypothetical protein MHYP_G00114710 [Metynnis hypsauchen]
MVARLLQCHAGNVDDWGKSSVAGEGKLISDPPSPIPASLTSKPHNEKHLSSLGRRKSLVREGDGDKERETQRTRSFIWGSVVGRGLDGMGRLRERMQPQLRPSRDPAEARLALAQPGSGSGSH